MIFGINSSGVLSYIMRGILWAGEKMQTIYKHVNEQDKSSYATKILSINDETSRKRVFASLLAIKAITEFFKEQGLTVDISDSCASNSEIIGKVDVADIRVNGARVDVRTVVGNAFPAMYVPREHFRYKMPIDIYVGVRLDKDLDNVEIMGFMLSENVEMQEKTRAYYIVDTKFLSDMSQINDAIDSVKRSASFQPNSNHMKAKELFIPYLDGNISAYDKKFMLYHLTNCSECRKEFHLLCGLDNKLSGITNPEVFLEGVRF